MNEMHSLLEQGIREVPKYILKDILHEKFVQQNVLLPDDVLEKAAHEIAVGQFEGIECDFDEHTEEPTIHLTDEDGKRIIREYDAFLKDRLPNVFLKITEDMATILAESLQGNWHAHHAESTAAKAEFAKKLRRTWGTSLASLSNLVDLSKEFGQSVALNQKKSGFIAYPDYWQCLVMLHGRACEVADDILVLLEHGRVESADARWRTLYEIYITLTVIADAGEETATRYLLHTAVESKRYLDAYNRCRKALNRAPLDRAEVREIVADYSRVVRQYGEEFATPYGWACEVATNKKPNFSDLENLAGRAMMRLHYKLASRQVHAGAAGAVEPLSAMDGLPVYGGRPSTSGLSKPGRNTALILEQLNALLLQGDVTLDDIVMVKTLSRLTSQCSRQLVEAENAKAKDEQRSIEIALQTYRTPRNKKVIKPTVQKKRRTRRRVRQF